MHVYSVLFLPADHKLAPKVGVAWGTYPILKFRDPLNISVSDEATLFKETVTTFTYRPSLVKINACNF